LGAGLFTRERIVLIALGLVSVLLVFLIVHDVLAPGGSGSAVQLTAVTRGTVRSAVTGTGTVTPMTQQNVNFGTGGQISEIDVKAGDKVTRGQTLAKLGPTLLQQSLDQANNNLVSAQATLNSTVNGNSATVAQHNLANAQQSLSDTQAQVNLTNQQDQAQLTSDNNQLDNTDQPALNAAQQAYTNAHCGTAHAAANCEGTGGLHSQLTDAQGTVAADQTRINQDNNKIATDQLSGQRSINQANTSVASAQDSLNSATVQRPNAIASQQASVNNAQIAVATAQRNLNLATLTAPFDGTVLSVNNQAGDTVSGGGTSNSSASSSSSSSSGGSGGGGNSGSSTSSSGTGFMALGDLTGFQVVAPFAEADAARVQANQQATVTFDAVTGLTLPARVASVAQTATVTSNVTNYAVTLLLDRIDSRLKAGMTANASVVVQQAQNVLTLPNSVITRIGGAAFVTLLGRDGQTQTRRPIQTGAVGDTATEIVGGLNQGDRVVRPSLRPGTAAGAGTKGSGGLGIGLGGGSGSGKKGGGG
jgi:multidrug efflux pump subunit AcrA (membrane-fusion protein)